MKKKVYCIKKTHIFQSDEYICSNCRYKQNKGFTVCPNCKATIDKSKYDPTWVDEMVMMDIMMDDWK